MVTDSLDTQFTSSIRDSLPETDVHSSVPDPHDTGGKTEKSRRKMNEDLSGRYKTLYPHRPLDNLKD